MDTTEQLRVPFSYLQDQFADPEPTLAEIGAEVRRGKFTLGPAVQEFEHRFAELIGQKHAIGVNSGTDALILSMKALGIGPGDEVITVPNTFVATVGAIVATGARPVFVDVGDDYNIDPSKVEAAITPATRLLLPVHLCGNPVDIEPLLAIAEGYALPLIEDACHAIGATYDAKACGSFGRTGCFSLHPLKNLNVWGDAGMIVTGDDVLCEKLKLMRNHGLKGRNEVEFFGINSRMDTIQAIVGNKLLSSFPWISEVRLSHARRLDAGLSDLPEVIVPTRNPRKKPMFHLYVIRVERRDDLYRYLNERGVEARIHYPKPLHLQPASAYLGYRAGDFPRAEAQAGDILTLPSHQHLSDAQIDFMLDLIHQFYRG